MTMSEPTAVYRLYNAARDLLYVGMSSSPETRWKNHARAQPWWAPDRVALAEVVWYETRAEAAAAERQAIKTENPRGRHTYHHYRTHRHANHSNSQGRRASRAENWGL